MLWIVLSVVDLAINHNPLLVNGAHLGRPAISRDVSLEVSRIGRQKEARDTTSGLLDGIVTHLW
jgi:hypothetical protein